MSVSTLIVIPTYNEADNIAALAVTIRRIVPAADVLVVDDASPDGTAAVVRRLAAQDPHVQLLERAAKLGLGSAYVAGFGWGLISDELGNRARIAISTGQIGALLTEIGQPAAALDWWLRALLLSLELRLPDVRVVLYWLRQQRTALGEESFQQKLREHLSEENAQAVVALLDQP